MAFLEIITPTARFIEYTVKFTNVAFNLRHVWQGGYFFGVGFFEAINGRVVKQEEIQTPQVVTTTKKVKVLATLWQKIGERKTFELLHGFLFCETGLFLSLEGLSYLRLIELGSFLTPLQFAGTLTFVFAKTLSLQYHVRLFLDSFQLSDSKQAFHQRISAITGIIKGLGYLLLVLTPLLGGSATFALVFGCIGLTTGSIKVLHDFFYPT